MDVTNDVGIILYVINISAMNRYEAGQRAEPMDKPIHVLVVEDHADVRKTLESMLDDAGFRVSGVDGGAAMRLFLEGEFTVDVVILDAAMPGETSASLAFFIGQLGLPMVMISGSPPQIELAHRKHLQLLEKPFGQEALLAAVSAALSFGSDAGQRSSD